MSTSLYEGYLTDVGLQEGHYTDPENIALFSRHGVFTETEIHSRQEILLENYCKVVHIEALTMLDMISRDILPAIMSYTSFLTDSALKKVQLGINAELEKSLAEKLSENASTISKLFVLLNDNLQKAEDIHDTELLAVFNRSKVITAMQSLRAIVDATEPLLPRKYWPYPTYGEMLFGIR